MSEYFNEDLANCLTKKPKYNETMSLYTSFRTGGKADCAVFPVNDEELCALVHNFKTNGVPYTVIGRGTNVLVSDEGIEGAVIILSEYKGIQRTPFGISANCGALLSETASFALKFSLSGMEALSGIPGSVGGAVTMNAGAYGTEMKDVLKCAKYLDLNDGLIKEIDNNDMLFGYRKSFFTDNPSIVLSAEFELAEGSQDEISGNMKRFNAMRRDKQPLSYPSAGSTFKRPEGDYAARLIDACGLKGERVGGAMVSEKHAGFIINFDKATSSDIIELIKRVRNSVLNKTGIMLETEIKIIGRNVAK